MMTAYTVALVASFAWIIPYWVARKKAKSSMLVMNRAMMLAPLCFMWGYLFRLGIDMWARDMMGLNEYVRFVIEYWREIPPIIGLGIAVFCGYMPMFMIDRLRHRFQYRLSDGQVKTIAEMEEDVKQNQSMSK